VVACARRHGDRWVVAVVPRLIRALTRDEHSWPIGERCWSGSTLELPLDLADRELRDVLTGARLRAERTNGTASLPLDAVFGAFPVAVLAALS